MKKNALIAAVIFSLVAGFLLLRKPSAMEAQQILDYKIDPSPSSLTSSQTAITTTTNTSVSISSIPFSSRLTQEAAKMDSQKMDFTSLEEELELWAKTMREEEKKLALDSVKNKSAPANERVLSAYLLGKAGAWPELLTLAKEPFERERAEPHSTGEMNNMRELSLRYMELDFLAESAKKNTALLSELVRLRSELRDPSLSRHLERRLKELGQ